MEQLNIPYLSASADFGIEQASAALDQQDKHKIKFAPWPEFNYQPAVSFAIAHTGSNILLKYYVEENAVAAVCRETNGPVYKDSCVEFFLAFNNDEGYYNIEFNCAGTGHIGFGSRKDHRQAVPVYLVEEVNYQTTFRTAKDFIIWELSLIIPASVFCFHDIRSLENQFCRANFYKCGDDLPQPHYLAWNNIDNDSPNFHLPQFFGNAHFADAQKVF